MASSWDQAWGTHWGDSWGAGVIPPATINYQGGAGYPVTRKKRRKRDTVALFESIEQSLRDLVFGVTEPAVTVVPVVHERLTELASVAKHDRDLQQRLVALRREIADYQERLLMEDEEEWMLLT